MKRDEIKVHVIDYGRTFLYMRYVDPMTGKAITRSSGESTRKAAQKAAGKWEAELREGRYKAASKITWAEFRQRYEDQVLPGLADTTSVKVGGVFDAVERIISPDRLASLTSERISHLVKVLRSEPAEVAKSVETIGADGRKRSERKRVAVTVTRSEATIRGHLATLKAALNWAKSQKMLHELPHIGMPKRAKGQKLMKGRPITAEEFDRMIEACVKVRPYDSAVWEDFLRGLWLSGLRINEALNLYWDDDGRLSVDLDGKHPMLRIPAACEKGNQDRLLPVAPEFAEMLLAVPQSNRAGRVFKLPVRQREAASRAVGDIGKAAGIKVNADPKTGKLKFASAHDLRRAFGARWASRVMPQVLMELMRHESIDTTLKYYVGRNAQTTADVLYAAVSVKGNTVGNSDKTGRLSDSAQVLS